MGDEDYQQLMEGQYHDNTQLQFDLPRVKTFRTRMCPKETLLCTETMLDETAKNIELEYVAEKSELLAIISVVGIITVPMYLIFKNYVIFYQR